MDNIKVIASQAKSVNSYKNIKTKLSQCCANIYFNSVWDPIYASTVVHR
jgi:hypothetical protein